MCDQAYGSHAPWCIVGQGEVEPPPPPTLRYTRAEVEKAVEGARVTTRDEVTEEVITKVIALVRRRIAAIADFGYGPPPTVADALDELAGDLADGEWRRDR